MSKLPRLWLKHLWRWLYEERHGMAYLCQMYDMWFLFWCKFYFKNSDACFCTQGRTTYDINVRTVYAISRCGVGLHGMTNFCGLLNMPPPITEYTYDIITKKLGVAAENVAATEGTDMIVSVDGTWQRRGLSSLNGVVAAVSVSTGKVVDIEIMSRNC